MSHFARRPSLLGCNARSMKLNANGSNGRGAATSRASTPSLCRYCWLRDSTFTLYALMESGYQDEARAWRDWLMRAIAGTPDNMQSTYGLAGERRLEEYELPHLKDCGNSKPVRVGNAASRQLQLDVFGEVLDSFYQLRRAGLAIDHDVWNLELVLARHLESVWREPDEGIWEVRGGRRYFTWSKIMAWVVLNASCGQSRSSDCPARFVARYDSESGVDGLPGSEGAFLACSFCLVDSYILQGRHDEARCLFEKLLALRNDRGADQFRIESDPPERAIAAQRITVSGKSKNHCHEPEPGGA